MTEQITVPRATWDALREALEKSRSAITYSERIDAYECAVQALTAANAVSHPQATEPQEAIAWEATTPGYIKYVTDKQYRSYSDTAKRWYKPYKCSSCHPQATEPAWRPIETAPKDGSEILLGHPDGSMAVGWWREARSHGRGSGWSDGDDFAMTWPSHWKPKPAAPEEKQ